MIKVSRLSRGGGIAILAKSNTFNCIIFSTIFAFDHSSFELVQATLALKKSQFNFSASTVLTQVERINSLILCFLINSQNCWNFATPHVEV